MSEDTSTPVLRDKRGRMLAPLPGKHTITKADASMLAHRRWEKYRQEAVKRIVEEAASVDPSVSTGAQAFGIVAAKQWSALMDSEKAAIDQLEKLGRIMTGENGQSSSSANVAPGAVSMQPDTLLRLLDALESRDRQTVDEARAIDGNAD